MSNQLTPAQLKALQTIADNPGRVVAYDRTPRTRDYIRINGNTEHGLTATGAAHEVETTTVLATWIENGEEQTVYVKVWELTDAGRDALAALAYDRADREYRLAADRAERTGDDADDAAADAACDAYGEAAEAIGRCNLLECEKDAEPGDGQCVTHIRYHGRSIDYTEQHNARTCPARALGEPCTACSLLADAHEEARVAYRQAVDDADGAPDFDERIAANIAAMKSADIE